MYSLTIPSKHYPDLRYEGEDDPLYEFLLHPEDDDLFSVHLFEEIAKDPLAVARVGHFLDDIDAFDSKARSAIEKAAVQEDDLNHETVSFFIAYHVDDAFSEEELPELFMTEDPLSLSPAGLLRRLKFVKMFTWKDDQGKQYFSLDYMFNPNLSDEILTVLLNSDFEIQSIDHES